MPSPLAQVIAGQPSNDAAFQALIQRVGIQRAMQIAQQMGFTLPGTQPGMAARPDMPGGMPAGVAPPPAGPPQLPQVQPAAMPTYDQRMDQAVMPPGQVAGSLPLAAIAAAAQPGPMDPSVMQGPRTDLPMPMDRPAQPTQMAIEGGWDDDTSRPQPARGRSGGARRPQLSESDRLNIAELQRILARRTAAATGRFGLAGQAQIAAQ